MATPCAGPVCRVICVSDTAQVASYFEGNKIAGG
jgi:hypothetical protein